LHHVSRATTRTGQVEWGNVRIIPPAFESENHGNAGYFNSDSPFFFLSETQPNPSMAKKHKAKRKKLNQTGDNWQNFTNTAR
jgi:hypothetical protein